MSDGLRIELEPGVTPIAGRIWLPTSRPVRFAGYVELIAALEDLRLAAADGEGTSRLAARPEP